MVLLWRAGCWGVWCCDGGTPCLLCNRSADCKLQCRQGSCSATTRYAEHMQLCLPAPAPTAAAGHASAHCSPSLQDKDGVTAAAVFAEMAAALAAQGTTVAQHLQALYQRYGHFVYRSGYFIADKPQYAQAVFDRLRHAGQYPTSVGGLKVMAVRDLGTGLDTSQPEGKAVLPWTPGEHATGTLNLLLAVLMPAGTMLKGLLCMGCDVVQPCFAWCVQLRGGLLLAGGCPMQLSSTGTWRIAAAGHAFRCPCALQLEPCPPRSSSLHCMCPPALPGSQLRLPDTCLRLPAPQAT